jgi:fatty-acid desaturase
MSDIQFKDKWYATLHVAIMCSLTLCLFLLVWYHDPLLIVVSVLIFKIVERLGLYVGLHMWISHHIIKPSGMYKVLVCISMLISNIGRPSFFAKYHTIHHRFVDSEKDPHSPKFFNKFYLIFGLYPLTMYQYDQFNIDQSKVYVDDKLAQFVDTYYYRILLTILSIGLYFSVQYTFYFFMLPMLFCNINNNIFFVYYLHRGGKSKNDKWLNYWIPDKGGEHRTHHMVGKYIEHNL